MASRSRRPVKFREIFKVEASPEEVKADIDEMLQGLQRVRKERPTPDDSAAVLELAALAQLPKKPRRAAAERRRPYNEEVYVRD